MRSARIRAVRRLALASALVATGAWAQAPDASEGVAPPAAGPDTLTSPLPAGPSESSAPPAPASDIVVTGSRIARQDYTASSPILTVGAAAIDRQGAVQIENALNELPQFTPSFGQANSFPSRGGQANLNLRGLGTNRALVLVNGRRVQPSNGDGTIDVNTIPRQMIENVETITGGASTAYGSDAIAGVINFKLRSKFEGIQVDGQYSLTEQGDAPVRQVGILAGTSIGERASIVVSVDYTDRARLLRGDRDFFQENGATNLAFLPGGVADLSANPPSQAAVNSVFNRYGTPPALVSRTRGFGINDDGTLFTSNPTTAPVFNYKGVLNDVYRIQNNAVIQAAGLYHNIQIPLERYNSFARGEYELTDNVKLFAQGYYSAYTAEVQVSGTPLGSLGQITTVPVSNPFIPADLRTLLNSRTNPAGDFVLNKQLPLDPRTQREEWDVYQVLAGASGKLPSLDWTWDATFSHGKTVNNSTWRGGISNVALQQLLRDPLGGAGRAAVPATPTSPALAAVAPLCEGGLNLFGDRPFSSSCLTYLSREAVNKMTLKQDVAEANLQGGVFELPAGSVRAAVGANYRRNTYFFDADPVVAAGDLIGYATSASGGGKANVWELYGELLVPVLRDLPLIHELNVGLAYRYSKYNTIGSVHTYKADADWAVTSWARVRGGYSRATRAPSVGELFAAPNSAGVTLGSPVANGAPAFAGDPCDVRSAYRTGPNGAQVAALCVAQGVPASAIAAYNYVGVTVFAVNQGNASLQEEKADTYSLGVVLRSPFQTPVLSRLSASIDYYNIKINDAIGALTVPISLSRCYNVDGVSNPSYSLDNFNCQQIVRSASTGAITNPTQPLLNLAAYRTSGVDAQVDWRIPLEALGLGSETGAVGLNFAATYLDKFVFQSLAGSPALDFAGTTGSSTVVQPRWKLITSLNYDIGPVELGGMWRHLSGVRDASLLTNANSTIAGVPAFDYFDLNARVRVGENFELRIGVNNVADKQPPQVGSAFGNTDLSTYDLIGRQFFVGGRVRF